MSTALRSIPRSYVASTSPTAFIAFILAQDFLVTQLCADKTFVSAAVPPGRQKRLASEVRVVMHRLKEVRREAAEEVAANVTIRHETKAVLYKVRKAMERERHLVSEAASQAAAARDILVKAPCVLQVIREAAEQLGASHKLSGDIGTPVNASIIGPAMRGESSQFDKIHAAVNCYLRTEQIAPYKASRDTVHRLLRYARYESMLALSCILAELTLAGAG